MRRGLWFIVAASLILSGTGLIPHSILAEPATPIAPAGELVLPNTNIVRFSPPTLVDLDGDGKQDILVGTYDGKVFALRHKSSAPHLSIVWSHDTASDLGSPTTIRGAISAADLDGNGRLEVLVPVGGVFATYTFGGFVVLDALSGQTIWTYRAYDQAGSPLLPDGYSDGVVSSPTPGDLDNDGDLEIVFGGFDQRVYAFHHDGSPVSGWPRFVRDTVWTSPALADLDNDGFLEIIFGIDTHHEGTPFNTPNGGGLYVFRGDGRIMPGWPKFIGQTIFSSPAVGDLDGDGDLEIVHGTGDYFNNPTAGNKLYAWDHQGNLLWTGATSGYVVGSPALGNLDLDPQLEVVVGAKDKYVYAWNHNGSLLWKTMPKDYLGQTMSLYTPVLADYNGNGTNEVFVNIFWETAVLDGLDGTQLTASFLGDSRPSYLTDWSTSGNAPALGDLDGDGLLELVSASGSEAGSAAAVYYWNLNTASSTATAPWPMFQQNGAHLGVHPQAKALDSVVVEHSLPSLMMPDSTQDARITLRNTGTEAWRGSDQVCLGAVDDGDPLHPGNRICLAANEAISPGQQRTFSLSLESPGEPGYYVSDWRLVSDAQGRWFGRTARQTVKVSNQPSLQVLSTGGIFAGGLATRAFPAHESFWNWAAAKVWTPTPDGRGYHMLDSFGGYWYGGETFPLVSKGPVSGLQDMEMGPDVASYHEMLSSGTIYSCSATTCEAKFGPLNPPISGSTARSLAVTPDGGGVLVVDAYGNLHAGGSASLMSPAAVSPPFSTDLARRIKLTPDGIGYYVMDVYGRVWNGGTASPIAPNYAPHVGEDWARDFELTEDGKGYYLLDRDGCVYSGGTGVPVIQNQPASCFNPGAAGMDLILLDGRVMCAPTIINNEITILTRQEQPESQTIELTSACGNALAWTAKSDKYWLTIQPSSGSTPAEVTITANPSSLPLGTYEGHVTISSPGASVVLTVRVNVVRQVYSVFLPTLRK